MENPFFIVGVPRSGTTLLSVLLDNHSKIYVDEDSVGINLVKSIKQFKRSFAFAPRQDTFRLLEQIADNSYKKRLRSLLDVKAASEFDSLQRLMEHSVQKRLNEKKKQIWGDKTPGLVAFIPEIRELFPSAKVIHIVRNPHANCKSLNRRQHLNIRLAAQHWKDANGLGVIQQYIYGSDRYHILKYEDLVLQPAATLQSVCRFLGVPFEEDMLLLARAKSTQSSNAYVGKTFDSSRLDDWKSQLSRAEIRSIEKITADLMPRFGYETVSGVSTDAARSLTFARRLQLKTADILKLLLLKNRIAMTGRKLEPVKIPLRKRVSDTAGQLARLYLSEEVNQIFLQLFRKSNEAQDRR